MKLTKRLKTICSLVDSGSNVIDIGCDHGLIDIYLTQNNNNKCIASDINENALEFAKNNIKKYNLEDKISTVISDGLEKIDIPCNNTIIICGMGTTTILKILSNSKTKKIDNLIIQSNNDLYLLRKSVTKLGFYIEKDIKIEDKNIFYTIIKFKKGYKKYKYYEYLYGIDLSNCDYINNEINKNNKIINMLPKNKFIKKISIKLKNRYLKKHL